MSTSAQLLLERPERLVDLWRCARYVEEGEHLRPSVLEGVLVSFLREIGAQLGGATGSPWLRTRGVLEIRAHEGTGPIYRELATLRRVMNGALDALHASMKERLLVSAALDEALSSLVQSYEHFRRPEKRAQSPLPGNVLVEWFEPSLSRPRSFRDAREPGREREQHLALEPTQHG